MKETTEETTAPKVPKVSRAMYDYESFISIFPAPGGGGAHVGFYKAGILGFKAGVDEATIFADIEKALDKIIKDKRAGRIPGDSEIRTSVHDGFVRAVEEKNGLRPPEAAKRAAPKLAPNTFARIALSNKGVTADDIMAKSPVPLDFPEWEAGWRTVDALYLPEDILYIGEFKGTFAIGKNIRPASEWVTELKKGPPVQPFIIPNPLTGEEAPLKDGSGMTLRGDGNVAKFKHLVAEMDGATIEDQLAFWAWADLPIRALIISGGKSIHAWVDVDCASVLEWEMEVEGDLFPNYLIPLGCDPACRNESRVSRLPGHTRREDEKYTGSMQKLIWLSPEGKAVCD